jgi:hypothetical protein
MQCCISLDKIGLDHCMVVLGLSFSDDVAA